MPKNTPYSQRSSKPGPNKTFKKDDTRKPFDKSSKPADKRYRKDDTAGSGDRPFKRDETRKPFDKSSKPFGKSFRKDDGAPSGDRPFKRDDTRKPFDKDAKPYGKSFRKDDGAPSGDRPFKRDDTRKPFDRDAKPYGKSFRKDDGAPSGDRPFKRDDARKPFDKDAKPFEKRPFKSDGPRPRPADKKGSSDAPPGRFKDSRPFRDRPTPISARDKDSRRDSDSDVPSERPAARKEFKPAGRKPGPGKVGANNFGKKKHFHDHSEGRKKRGDDDDIDDEDSVDGMPSAEEQMPLNKFIAHSGECSRRDAAELVKQGKVKVNGELVLEPGHKIAPGDLVTLSGKKLKTMKGMVYILLNKPKGYITTNDDPQGRRTVMELVASSGAERLFPVGRLDRDTTGLLLITNDGDLTQKLCHPSYKIKKVYQVTLDKALTKADFEKIMTGLTLDDGEVQVDALAYLEKKNELGIEIHSGRNRIVRRIFESLGYVVDKLDRVTYAGLTKKNLPRSKWRFLDEREIVLLKHFKS